MPSPLPYFVIVAFSACLVRRRGQSRPSSRTAPSFFSASLSPPPSFFEQKPKTRVRATGFPRCAKRRWPWEIGVRRFTIGILGEALVPCLLAIFVMRTETTLQGRNKQTRNTTVSKPTSLPHFLVCCSCRRSNRLPSPSSVAAWPFSPWRRLPVAVALQPVLRQTITMTQDLTTNPVSFHVTRGALLLGFQLLFLRDPGPGERDFILFSLSLFKRRRLR